MESINAVYRMSNETHPYQQWTNYPDTPVLTASCPYQCIYRDGTWGVDALLYCAAPLIYEGSAIYSTTATIFFRPLSGGAWGSASSQSANNGRYATQIKEANNNLFTNSSFTDIAFAKTTTPSQDGTGPTKVRVRTMVRT